MEGIFRAWGSILTGYRPCLSIEITKECPLRCPGCYAYGPDHLGGETPLRQLSDLKGKQLVEGVLELVRKHKPVHVSLIGGEPLVRYRELNEILPELSAMGVHTQVVTSAVRPIPWEWTSISRLQICVSVDGLQKEHDERRSPATYDRIFKNIKGHQVTIHCTITRQQVIRDDYIYDFARFWSAQSTTKRIWFSLYTPQIGENSQERLEREDRIRAIEQIRKARKDFPKIEVPDSLLAVYENPPDNPARCLFANVTACLSADLSTRITPCQFGGNPDCSNCGCMASAGLGAVGRYRLLPGVTVGSVFQLSSRIGTLFRKR